MRLSLWIFLLITVASFSQEKIDADTFIGVDNLENYYYIKNNVLFKKSAFKTVNYNNLLLGKITSVDITNPLKVVVFYKDFNSAIILDDELNELSNTIDFNSILQKNIVYAATAINANLWLFSQEDNSLVLFDYLKNQIVFTTLLGSEFNFKTAVSNYKDIWLVSDENVFRYNIYGSFIAEEPIKNINKAITSKNGIIYSQNKKLFTLENDKITEIILPETYANTIDFYYNNDLLYFFDGNTLYTKEFIKK